MASAILKNGKQMDPDDGPNGPDEADARELPSRPHQPPRFFSVYKKGQGYWTRMGTAIGAGLIITVTALFAHSQAAAFATENRWIPIAVTTAVVVAGAIVAWLIMNKPRNVDFLIATDSEMKKVNWTSRKELMGSTRVVIVFMFFIAAVLFLTDVVVTEFFRLIGLLKFGLFG